MEPILLLLGLSIVVAAVVGLGLVVFAKGGWRKVLGILLMVPLVLVLTLGIVFYVVCKAILG